MASPLINVPALFNSLVKRVVHEQTLNNLNQFKGAPAPATPPDVKTRAQRMRSTHRHLQDSCWPKSLVYDDRANKKLSHGMEKVYGASHPRKSHDARRSSACWAAKSAADAAVFALTDADLYGDEDGKLQEMVELSLEKERICDISDLYDHIE